MIRPVFFFGLIAMLAASLDADAQTVSVKTLAQLRTYVADTSKAWTITILNDLPIIDATISLPPGADITLKGQASQSGRRRVAGESSVLLDDGDEVTRRVRIGGGAALSSGHVYLEVQAGAKLRVETLEFMTFRVGEEALTNAGGQVDYIRGCNFYGPGDSIANWNGGRIGTIESSYFIRTEAQVSVSGIRSMIRNLYGSTINLITKSNFVSASAGGGINNMGNIDKIELCEFNLATALLSATIVSKELQESFTQKAAGAPYAPAIQNSNFIGSISQCSFEGLLAQADGGAILNAANARIGDIGSCMFEACAAGDEGGAIYSAGIISSITSSMFVDNAAGENGGAIVFSGVGAKLTNGIASCTFSNNYAGSSAGAVNLRAGAAIGLAISNSKFLNNRGIMYGGAISLDAGTNSIGGGISNCEFTGNSAARGGAIHVANLGAINGVGITQCVFTSNAATSFFGGGAIFIASSASQTLAITKCRFIRNTGANGGAVRVYLGGFVYMISECDFDSNSGELYGGAISNYATLSYIENCRFSKNSASMAAAIHNDDARITSVRNSAFLNNFGGGVALLNTVGVIDSLNGVFFAGNGGKGVQNQYIVRNILNSAFIDDIIVQFGQDINALSGTSFSSESKRCMSNGAATNWGKSVCPQCKNCGYGKNAYCNQVNKVAITLPGQKDLCSAIPGCEWSGSSCGATSGSDIPPPPPPDDTFSPTVAATPAPTVADTVSCESINKLKSAASRASTCRARLDCVFNNKKKCTTVRQRAV